MENQCRSVRTDAAPARDENDGDGGGSELERGGGETEVLKWKMEGEARET